MVYQGFMMFQATNGQNRQNWQILIYRILKILACQLFRAQSLARRNWTSKYWRSLTQLVILSATVLLFRLGMYYRNGRNIFSFHSSFLYLFVFFSLYLCFHLIKVYTTSKYGETCCLSSTKQQRVIADTDTDSGSRQW